MELIFDGVEEALRLIFSGDAYVYEVLFTSLYVSGVATLIALAIGFAIASLIAMRAPPGKTLAVSAFNVGMALPPVTVGLVVSILLWRSGPLGELNLLYTRTAIIIAQAVIATPVVTALSIAALQSVNPLLRLQIAALGASRWQSGQLLFREARLSLLAAVMAGFGAAISEVGATMVVGGNIKGETRTLTSATVLEVQKGNFDTGIAFSMILLLVIFCVVGAITVVQQRRPSS